MRIILMAELRQRLTSADVGFNKDNQQGNYHACLHFLKCSIPARYSDHRLANAMRRTAFLALASCRRLSRTNFYQCQKQSRPIATHTISHHASALSVLPTNVDTSSVDFKENAAHFGELLAGMRELHQKIEQGGPLKAREKHVARGKMLPRE